MEIEDLLADIERLFASAQTVALTNEGSDISLNVREQGFWPFTDDEIAGVVQAGKTPPPASLRRFWKRGFRPGSLAVSSTDGEDGFGGLEFNPAGYLLRGDIVALRRLADDISDPAEKRLHLEGYPLTADAPAWIVAANGAVHLAVYDGDSVRDPVTSSLEQFFEHWLAIGCYVQGHFPTYWKGVSKFVSRTIPARDNLVLRALDVANGTSFAR